MVKPLLNCKVRGGSALLQTALYSPVLTEAQPDNTVLVMPSTANNDVVVFMFAILFYEDESGISA
jgi:hypothetical protein